MSLADELATDPLGRGYSGMTDQGVVDSLNEVNRPAPVPAKDVMRYLIIAGKWGALKNSSDNTAVELVDAVLNFDDFDLQDSTVLNSVTAKLDALISANLLEQANKTALLSLENSQQSRMRELGLSGVLAGHVGRAR